MGKVNLAVYERLKESTDGKLVLVSAITPDTRLGKVKQRFQLG